MAEVDTDTDTPHLSTDPEGELLAERSVIAMSKSVVAAVHPSHSVASSARRTTTSGRPTFTVQEEEEIEECKEEISSTPFDTSLDMDTLTVPQRKWHDLTTTNESVYAARHSVDYDKKERLSIIDEKQARRHPEEPSRSDAPGLFVSKKNVVIGVLALLSVILAIVLVVVLLQDDSSSSSSTDRSAPIGNETPTDSPVSTPTPLMPTVDICTTVIGEDGDDESAANCTEAVDYLAPVHPTRTWSRLSFAGTCQNSALLWLLDDTSVLDLDQTSVQQRYSLAVTLCELEGGSIQDWEEKVVSSDNSDTPCFTIFRRDADQNGATFIVFNPKCDYKSIVLDGGRDQQSERRMTRKVREDSRMLAEAPHGTLAAELSIATSLEIISITNGLIKGQIPSEYGQLTQLKSLDLSNNDITGTITPQILPPQMENLLLHENNLTGTFIVNLTAAPNLRVVNVCDQQGGSLSVYAADLDRFNCSCCLPAEFGAPKPITAFPQVTSPPTRAKTPAPTKAPVTPILAPEPCEQNPLCGLVMEAISRVFPPATSKLYYEQGTCQNTARDWMMDWLARMSDQSFPSEDRIRQRYTMELLSCEFQGEEWNNVLGDRRRSSQHECEWLRGLSSGQPCDDSSRVISHLFLPRLKISGTLPPEISILSLLRDIDFSDNRISGTIPTELGQLTLLQSLFLENNILNGTIPTELGQLTNLGDLLLGNNKLSGSMPNEVCLLRSDKLYSLVVDCQTGPPETGGAINSRTGVACPCCTFCWSE